jgi:phosphoribosyl 1,2-cyclic phosphate phosphodiesterase
MSLKLTILGCGSSGGVPRIGGEWGACDPHDPRNRRRRCSVLVERKSASGTTTVMVDASPDVREQLLDAGVGWLDGVLFSHDHADHVHGIDDLRIVAYNGGRKVQVYYDERTGRSLRHRFDYCFASPPGSSYPPIVSGNVIRHGRTFPIEGRGGPICVTPFRQTHGDVESLGFRIGGLAYSSDLNDLPAESIPFLEGLDLWVVDALRHSPHPSHFSVEQALAWVERLKPKRTVLTHLHVDLDYETLRREAPPGVEPAFDGMVIEAEG